MKSCYVKEFREGFLKKKKIGGIAESISRRTPEESFWKYRVELLNESRVERWKEFLDEYLKETQECNTVKNSRRNPGRVPTRLWGAITRWK